MPPHVVYVGAAPTADAVTCGGARTSWKLSLCVCSERCCSVDVDAFDGNECAVSCVAEEKEDEGIAFVSVLEEDVEEKNFTSAAAAAAAFINTFFWL